MDLQKKCIQSHYVLSKYKKNNEQWQEWETFKQFSNQ